MQASLPRRDFSGDLRLLRIAALAAVIGAFSTLAARVLLLLIRFFTDLFFYGRFSLAELSPADNRLGAWVILVPAIGGLLIGLIARFGTEQIRGHGIPEAIEAILFKNSAMSPKVALLKPLASGIAIGSGGPFGAEGPIIMTSGAIGSLVAQHVRLTGGERKTLLVAGAVAGMMNAPVMAAVFAFEVTHDGNALLPLLAACAGAYGFTVLSMGRSILTEKIARRGRHIYREYGIDPLERHAVAEVMTTDVEWVDADATAAQVLASHFGPGQRHRAFPVLRDGLVAGMVDRGSLEHALARLAPDARIRDLVGLNPPLVALPGETCRAVAARLAVHKLERLPVVADPTAPRLLGLVSRSDLIQATAGLHAEEHERTALRGARARGRA
ncbi:chloride channel protein [Massilia sp. 9096]|uniref:chloride channel protein n=1 Tax=Massilia sp. 9096 TaxID=1500894 RepID=UPI00056BEACC|nr:chloride channel protein [Massilia sp. 9096]